MPFFPGRALRVEELHTRISTCGFDYVYDGNMVDGPRKDEHHRVAMMCSLDPKVYRKKMEGTASLFRT